MKNLFTTTEQSQQARSHSNSSITEALNEYNEECSISSVYERIKTQYQKDIAEKLNDVCSNSRIMANISYHLMKMHIIDKSSFLDFNSSNKLLNPLNTKKSNFASNIDDLLSYISIKSPDIFAQIVYATLPNADIFSDDDRLCFSICTVPSIFKYYVTSNSQKYFTEFVLSLFDVHNEVNGFSFNMKHKFMKDIIFSFFNQFGTSDFVRSAFDYVFPMYASDLLASINKYTKLGKGLARIDYDFHIEALASKFVSRLWFSIPMIAWPVRNFIAELLEKDKDDIIALFFVFDALVSDQLSYIMQVCNLLDDQQDGCGEMCTLKKRIAKDLSVYLKEQYGKSKSINNRRVLVDFVHKVADKKSLEDEKVFNSGILHFSPCSYFSNRDVSLMYTMIKEFCSCMEKDVPEPLTLFISLYERHFEKQELQSLMSMSHSMSTSSISIQSLQSLSPSPSMDLSVSAAAPSTFQTPTKFQAMLLQEEEYFIKVVEYQKYEEVTQWNNSIVNIKNKGTLDSAIASLKIDSIIFPSKVSPSDIMINLLSHQVPELRYHMHQGEVSFQKVSKMAKNNREKFEEISNTFTSTLNHIDGMLAAINKSIHLMRVGVLRLSLTQEINALLLNGDHIRFPLFLEGIYESMHQYCQSKGIEEYENEVQRISMLQALYLFGRHFYVCGQPLSEAMFSAFAEKYEAKIRTEAKKAPVSKTVKEKKERCSQTLELLKFCSFDVKLMYSVIIKAMKEVSTSNEKLIGSAFVTARIELMKEYQKFFSAFVYNKQRIITTFGKEENQCIALFIRAVNDFLV